MTAPLHRRTVLAALPAAALATGCKGHAEEPSPLVSVPPLKMVAPFPVAVCVSTGNFDDPAILPLILSNFSQFTAEWQMKMETILQDDGSFAFEQPDRIVDFAGQHAIRMHAHALIWYAQKPIAFQRIEGNRTAFQNAYRNYIAAVAGRYRGRVVSWDVVNEPVEDEGGALRQCMWSKSLGQIGYMVDAFHLAREADDQALLFLNDYWLEKRPEKRRAFLRLAEQLLKAGAPLQGLGSQTHLDIGMAPGSVKAAIGDLASLGLPIHISELDVSTRFSRFDIESDADKAQRQARLVHETVEAFMTLPERQRFAITNWGVRDSDSWMQRPPNPPGVNKPLLFDAEGRPKPAAAAFVAAVTGR